MFSTTGSFTPWHFSAHLHLWSLMIWLYRLLFLPGFLLLAPGIAWRKRKRPGHGKYRAQRSGHLPGLPPKRVGVCRIWLQAVSVGELQAVAPLINHWKSQSDVEIVLTTTTSTGYQLARERYQESVLLLSLFPIDFWPFSARAWNQIQPDLALLMESELWPEHLYQAQARSVPVYLINARLSDRSYRRYRRCRPLAAWLFNQIHTILAATDQDAQRFRHFARQTVPVTTMGNLKLDVDPGPALSSTQRSALLDELGFSPARDSANPLILLGSSTWPHEEAFLLEVQTEARRRGIDCRLLLVPRHAERRDELRQLLNRQNQPWALRSEEKPAPAGTQILVADTTGELRLLTQAADLAFIGKSLPPHQEGQTPLECAALGVPLVTGPGMLNFAELTDSLEAHGGCRRGAHPTQCQQILLELMEDPEQRQTMAGRAQQWHRNNRGSVGRVLEFLNRQRNLLTDHDPSGTPR